MVMDPEVLRQNNNYPFKTTPQHTWHICLSDGGDVIGFMPAKKTSSGSYVDNYYIRDDVPEILDALIDSVVSATDRPVTALCHKRHTAAFREHGFVTCTVFALYNKMKATPGQKGEQEK